MENEVVWELLKSNSYSRGHHWRHYKLVYRSGFEIGIQGLAETLRNHLGLEGINPSAIVQVKKVGRDKHCLS
jgi:hypothetical protein